MDFSAVAGHNHQKSILSSLVEKGKLPHALLFAGPAGVGKRTMAMELIKNIFCEKGCACGRCRPCRKLTSGQHPDFLAVRGETSIKIDELRQVRKEVCEPPFEAPLRAILIDNAELMTREAANALLKTLEEPPPANVFLLIASQEQTIPLTVRSRCMRLGFGLLSRAALQSHFEANCGLDQGKAEFLSSIASGSVGTGLFWMDEDRLDLRRRIGEFLSGKRKGFTMATLLAERMTKDGNETQYLSFLLSFFRDCWWLAQGGSQAGMINSDLTDLMDVKAEDIQHRAQACIAKVQETIRRVRYNVNKWLAVEHLMLDLMEYA